MTAQSKPLHITGNNSTSVLKMQALIFPICMIDAESIKCYDKLRIGSDYLAITIFRQTDSLGSAPCT